MQKNKKEIMSNQEAIDHNIRLLQDHIIPMFKKRYIKEIDSGKDLKLQVYIYIQLHLRRCVELTEGIVNSAQNNHALIATSCARAILETVACFNNFCIMFEISVKNGNYKEAYEIIDRFIRATRDEEYLKIFSEEEAKKYRATNIKTHIPKLLKRNSSVEQDYDKLCEIVHPNYDGLFGLYGSLNENSNMITFSSAEKSHQQILEAMLIAAKYLKSLGLIFNEVLDLLSELEVKK